MASEVSSFKVVIVGESGVGKSNIISSILGGESEITTGEGVAMRSIEVQRKKARLQIFDTIGKEAFQRFIPTYYKGSQGVMVVYDMTDENSFEHVPKWLDSVYKHGERNVVTMLVGNKCDIEDKRVISEELGQQLASERDVSFMEVSTMTGLNISEAFDLLTEAMLDKQCMGEEDEELAVNRNHCVVL